MLLLSCFQLKLDSLSSSTWSVKGIPSLQGRRDLALWPLPLAAITPSEKEQSCPNGKAC